LPPFAVLRDLGFLQVTLKLTTTKRPAETLLAAVLGCGTLDFFVEERDVGSGACWFLRGRARSHRVGDLFNGIGPRDFRNTFRRHPSRLMCETFRHHPGRLLSLGRGRPLSLGRRESPVAPTELELT
jgi:hypothetical protein